MSTYHVFAALISLAAFAGYLNYRLLRLPSAIGMVLIVLALPRSRRTASPLRPQ